MNIIIPCAGLGSRFQNEGYRYPKPLVNIVGRPMLSWILDNLAVKPDDTIWITLNEQVDSQFALVERMQKEFPKYKIRPVHVHFQTRGAAETLYVTLQNMTEQELSMPVISLDSDTLYRADVLGIARNCADQNLNGIVCFDVDPNTKPIYSYVSLNQNNIVTEIREKVAISNHANTGAYIFRSGKLLRSECEKLLSQGVASLGEYYTSNVIAQMIQQSNEQFLAAIIDEQDFSCLGTPAQLKSFLQLIKQGQVQCRQKMRFCFDLDGTLVTHPRISGDYSSVEPICQNINLLRELKAAGHTIIIHTARRMLTHKGNVGAVIADVGSVTMDSLKKLNIPYDELYFGKPYAHCYIDDYAVNALVDTHKEIGWLEEQKSTSDQSMIAARDFHQVNVAGGKVTKSSEQGLAGETYFYRNIPSVLQHLFPKVHYISDDNKLIVMDRVQGVTFSHLLRDNCLTKDRLVKLMQTIQQLHLYKRNNDQQLEVDDNTLHANYLSKCKARFEKYETLYQDLGIETQIDTFKLANQIFDALKTYESEHLAQKVDVVHGDPVLSNILHTSDGRIVMIDMRGSLGSVLTTQGDAYYDWAKLYQSLCGYDIILLEHKISERHLEKLETLQKIFWSQLKNLGDQKFFETAQKWIPVLTLSLLFSLIPLHSNRQHQQEFLKLAQQINM